MDAQAIIQLVYLLKIVHLYTIKVLNSFFDKKAKKFFESVFDALSCIHSFKIKHLFGYESVPSSFLFHKHAETSGYHRRP